MRHKAFTLLLLGGIAALTLAAGEKITGAGASFPAPLYGAWAQQYEKATSNPVEYRSIGSGGGIKLSSRRKVDFGATDKPLEPSELSKKKLLQFPAAIGAIVLVYNLPDVGDGMLKLQNSVVAEIFSGAITHWDDAKIKADNTALVLPHERIMVAHRSDSSGTTYNFTDYLSKSSPAWKKTFGAKKAIDWAVGVGGKGNAGVAALVAETVYGIGYVENGYRLKNHLDAAMLQSAAGKWVKAEEEHFKAAATHALWKREEGFHALLTMQPAPEAYPIVAATFILLPKEFPDVNKRVAAFFEYAFSKGDAQAQKLGYIPLPEATKQLVRSYWSETLK